MAEEKLPEKPYYRIGEVSSLVGVEPHVLRYWEREFRTIRPQKSARGQRVYSRRDVETLMRVRQLLYKDGFTIAGARRKLQQDRVASEEDATMAPATASAAVREPQAAEASLPDGARPAVAPLSSPSLLVAGASPSPDEPRRAKTRTRTPSLPLFAAESAESAAPAVEAPRPEGARDRDLREAPAGLELRAVLRELRGEIEVFLEDLR